MKISNYFINVGIGQIKAPKKKIDFTKNSEWDEYLNNLDKYSHLFILACIGDKQLKAERAWKIPIEIGLEINSFDFNNFCKLTEKELLRIFKAKNLHRFNEKVAKEYFKGINLIKDKYNNLASNIWNQDLNSSAIILKLLEFDGIGLKIASMAVNILYRHFKIPILNVNWIDVSPDIHVCRVFQRTNLVHKSSTREEVIWKARLLYPDYPGVFDIATFNLGKEICTKVNPNCNICPITNDCPKNIINDH